MGGEEKKGSSIRDWIDIALKTIIAGLAALGTYYLSFQKQTAEQIHAQQVQTNEDVKLVVDLVDGSTPARRTIGLAIAKAYSGVRIPAEVYDAVNIVIASTSTRLQNQENNVISGLIPTGEAAKMGAQPVNSSFPTRVYIQYQRPEDLEAIAALRQGLNGAVVKSRSVIAPPVELVKTAIAQPVLKCFRKTECDDLGQALVDRMKEIGAPTNLSLQYITGYENSTSIRPNHFEAWLGPLPAQQPKL